MDEAIIIAQEIVKLDAADRRVDLQKLKGKNEKLWLAVKAELQKLDEAAKPIKPPTNEVYTIFGEYLDLIDKDARIPQTNQDKLMVAALLTLGNIILGD